VPGAVIAEARSIRDQSPRLQALAEEDGLTAEPRMPEVPDFVAPDDDRVITVRLLRPIEREGAGQRQGCDRAQEFACLRCIAAEKPPRCPLRKLRLQCAPKLGPANVGAVMVEQFDLVAASAQAFYKA